MKKISLKEKRFFILWFCVNAFALFVNIAHIRGVIQEYQTPEGYSGYIQPKETKPAIYLWTKANDIITGESIHENEHGFYPFTETFFFTQPKVKLLPNGSVFMNDYGTLNTEGNVTNFYGVFNGYGYLEFIVYVLLGFAIIYLPKIWRGDKSKNIDHPVSNNISQSENATK